MTNPEASEDGGRANKTESDKERIFRLAEEQIIRCKIIYIDSREEFINLSIILAILFVISFGTWVAVHFSVVTGDYLVFLIPVVLFLGFGFCFVVFEIIISTSNMRKISKLQKMLEEVFAATLEYEAANQMPGPGC